MAHLVQTPDIEVEGQQELAGGQEELAQGATASLKFNKLPQQSKKQLHSCYHSKQNFFKPFALGFGFNENEIFFLTIIIEAEYSEQCVLCGADNTDIFEKKKYKDIEKENIEKIDAFFDEQIDFLHEYQRVIKQEYKEQSQQHFNSGNKTNLNIKLDSIKDKMVALLDECYHIIDVDEPDPPLISLLDGREDTVLLQILDEDRMLNDKYEILINNTISNEYMPDDNKQQYIELKDILPLTKYSISARRYLSEKKRWSKYCEPVDIVTNFKCLWSKDLHGRNARLSNSYRDVCCKSKKGSCSIVGDVKYILQASCFKEVAFSFKMNELAQFSYFGFVEYPMDFAEFRHDISKYFDNDLVVKHSDSYCLGCCNGSVGIQRWINGSKKGKKKKFQNKDLKLGNGEKIKNGDTFLFCVNFDRMICDVYVNQKSQQNKVSAQVNDNTFVNIPKNIVPVYSHENNPYIIANSKVSINIEHYVLRR